MADESWVEGELGTRDFVIEGDGAPLPGGLSGKTVTMRLNRADGTLVREAAITIVDPVNCIVRFTPQAGDFVATNSPMTRRFHIMPDDKFHPGGPADVLTVRKP